jgi:tetratricopeptide (TPR) repeat protein
MNTKLISRFAACLTIAFLSGCVAPNQKKVITWDRDSNEAIVEFQKPVVQPNDLNYSLTELDRGLLFFRNGDYFHSDTRFANALKVMDRIKEKGEGGAVAVDERAKTFKGEPYERAIAYFSRGMCRFNQGDYSGALASFRSSLSSDAETRNKERRFLEDFTISQFMAALCYQRLGEPDNAEAMLMLARTNAPNNPFLTAASLKHNFVAILGIGDGPFKIKARTYLTGLAPEKKVELVIDDGSPAQPAEATDLLAQAKSQQRGAADNARVARKAGKFVLSVLLSAATGVNVNIEDYDDIRSWYGLPLKLYIFTADVPPGNHTINLKCYDEKGKELERNSQVWFDVPVSATPGPVLVLRDYRNWQNHHNVEHVKLNQAQDTPAK